MSADMLFKKYKCAKQQVGLHNSSSSTLVPECTLCGRQFKNWVTLVMVGAGVICVMSYTLNFNHINAE